MPRVEVRKYEKIESALRRFKRACEDSGLFDELRARESYEKPSVMRKRLKAAAVSRERRRNLEQSIGYKKPAKKEEK